MAQFGFEDSFVRNEGDFWQKLIEGEVIDLDLFTACAIGDFNYVRGYLAKVKPEDDVINKKNNSGWTPLMYVCRVGHDKILEFLLHERADITRQDGRGLTALMLASGSGNTAVVQRLVQEGADVNGVDKAGRTALFHAAEQGHLNVVKFLLNNKADASMREYVHGYTPFMEAARNGNEFVFNRFLEYGINLSLVCKDGLTCRDLAYKNAEAMVIVNMIDNHLLKNMPSVSLRDDPELGVPDFGVEDELKPRQKVHHWFNEHNTDFMRANTDVIRTEEKASFLHAHRNTSYPLSIEHNVNTQRQRGDAYGMSAETLVDCDRTPVGTPVDSLLQHYMAGETKHLERYFNDNLPSIESFLEKLHLEKYQPVFDDESVDFKVLLSLTEEDFKDLGLKLGPRRKLNTAITKWKHETRSPSGGQGGDEVMNLKRQLADVLGKLQRLKTDYLGEKDARSLIEAELMVERARRNHMYYVAGKMKRSCQELHCYTKDLREVAHRLEGCVLVKPECIGEDLHSKLKTLHTELSEDVQNTDTGIETLLRHIRKMMSDDHTELSSESDSPSESSCTSMSKSEGSFIA